MAELKNPELKDKLQKAAKEQKALLMSFIAPDSIIKTSPASYDYATIRVQDLYRMEKIIEGIKKQGALPKQLHLIVHTPGGDLYASTKIAHYLQKVFGSNIKVFVPYEAASGGTILCLAGKSIVMDAASNLTPIDPQITYKTQRVSVTSYEQAIKEFKDNYGNSKPEEIPSPFQQMGAQFDPIIAKEHARIAWDVLNVAYKLLKKSQDPQTPEQKKKVFGAVFKLGNSEYSHNHVISMDEASDFGLNIDQSPENLTLLLLYKEWVSDRLKEKEAAHIIDVFYPIKKPRKAKKEEKNETKKEKIK